MHEHFNFKKDVIYVDEKNNVEQNYKKYSYECILIMYFGNHRCKVGETRYSQTSCSRKVGCFLIWLLRPFNQDLDNSSHIPLSYILSTIMMAPFYVGNISSSQRKRIKLFLGKFITFSLSNVWKGLEKSGHIQNRV